jgi:hypothetical protein
MTRVGSQRHKKKPHSLLDLGLKLNKSQIMKDVESLCEIFLIQEYLPNGKNVPGCVWTCSMGCKIIREKNKFIAKIFKTDLNLCQSSRFCNSFTVK